MTTSLQELAKGAGFAGPQISLEAVLSHYGVTSFAEAVVAQEIEQFHSANLGILTVGSPVGPMNRTLDGEFQQRYSFGSIIKPAGTFPDVGKRFHVTVILAGVRCFGTDDPSGTDEPFLITSVFTLDPREKEKASQTKRIGPDGVGDVEVGRVFGQNSDLAVDFAVPGDSDIALNVQLFDQEAITNPDKAARAISDGNTAAILGGLAVLTALVPPAGAVAAGALAVLKASGLLDTFSDGIGKIIASLFSDDHLGTVDLRITHQFLETLRDNPKILDRRSDAIGGETYNFPQLPEDDSEAGKSWMFRQEDKGTYRPFFRIVLTEEA
jgi:hypothetical protein